MQAIATPEMVKALEGILWTKRPDGCPAANLRDEHGVPIPILVGKPGGGNRYATRDDAALAYKIYQRNWMRQKRLKLKLEKQTKEESK